VPELVEVVVAIDESAGDPPRRFLDVSRLHAMPMISLAGG